MEQAVKIMTKIALLISVVTIVLMFSCASTAKKFKPDIICEPKLCPYVQRVIDEINKRHIKVDEFKRLIVKVGIIRRGYAGLSTEFFEPERYIFISPDSLYNYTDTQLLALIAHEIGHALLHRKHDNRKVRGIAKSIMISQLQAAETYVGRMDEYFDELFSVSDNINGYDDHTVISD
jgi:hypothetical protein